MIQEAADAASTPSSEEIEETPSTVPVLSEPEPVEHAGVDALELPPAAAAAVMPTPRQAAVIVSCGATTLRLTLSQKLLAKTFSAAVLEPFLGAYNKRASTSLRPADLLSVRIDGDPIATSAFESSASSLLPLATHRLELTPPPVSDGKEPAAKVVPPNANRPKRKAGMELIALCLDAAANPKQIVAAANACSPDDMRCKDEERDKTAMHFLIMRFDDPELIRVFIKRGADVNAVDYDSCTPLMVAALHQRLKTVRVLLESGADTTIQALDGDTPLDVARDAENSKMVALFTAHSYASAR